MWMTTMMMVMVVVVVLMMIAWFECFCFVFVCFFISTQRGKAPLIIGIFLVFFSSVLSARITSGTGCFRNMAGSWGKVLAKPCRVRTHSSVHTYVQCMLLVVLSHRPLVIFFPLHISRFFFVSANFLFSSHSFSDLSICVWVKLIFTKQTSVQLFLLLSCCCSLELEEGGESSRGLVKD